MPGGSTFSLFAGVEPHRTHVELPVRMMPGWPSVVYSAGGQRHPARARAICAAFVGRPRRRGSVGGRTIVEDSSQASTSSSYQASRLECGILKGLGIRCTYFWLVAQVRIVVAVFPISCESSSMKRMRLRRDLADCSIDTGPEAIATTTVVSETMLPIASTGRFRWVCHRPRVAWPSSRAFSCNAHPDCSGEPVDSGNHIFLTLFCALR